MIMGGMYCLKGLLFGRKKLRGLSAYSGKSFLIVTAGMDRRDIYSLIDEDYQYGQEAHWV